MVEVSSLTVRGTIDTKAIERGLNTIQQGLGRTQGYAKSAFGDFERLKESLSSLALSAGAFGIGILGVFAGIAKGAPQVAPALARMQVAFTKLQLILGQALAPAFNKAAEMFERFVGFVSENQDTIARWADSALDGVNLVVGALGKIVSGWTAAENARKLYGETGGEEGSADFKVPGLARAASTLAGIGVGGKFGGPLGAIFGGAAGFAIPSGLEARKEYESRREAGEGMIGSANRASRISGWEYLMPAASGGARGIGAIIGLIDELIMARQSSMSRKNVSMNTSSTYVG